MPERNAAVAPDLQQTTLDTVVQAGHHVDARTGGDRLHQPSLGPTRNDGGGGGVEHSLR